jgi:hypothetical protein
MRLPSSAVERWVHHDAVKQPAFDSGIGSPGQKISLLYYVPTGSQNIAAKRRDLNAKGASRHQSGEIADSG